MTVILSPDEFSILERCFETGAPDRADWQDDPPPVPTDTVTALRYKLLQVEASRRYELDLDEHEASVLQACFDVGAGDDEAITDTEYEAIQGKLHS